MMKTTAVCMHGMWSNKTLFNDLCSKLEEHMPVEVIDLDRTNIGKLKYVDYLNQVQRFLAGIDSDEIKVIGHSMGGHLAQKVEDSRIRKRILLAPAAPRGVCPLAHIIQPISLLVQLNQALGSTVRPTSDWAKRVAFNCHELRGIPWDINECPPESYKVFDEVFWGIYAPRRKNVHVVVGGDDLIIHPKTAMKIAKYHGGNITIFPHHDHYSICHDEEIANHIVHLATH